MGIGDKLRWNLFVRACKKITPVQQSTESKNTGNLQRVGLLFDGTNHEHRQQVNRFRSKLEIQGKSVFIFGYIDQRLKINSFSFPHIYKNDVGWNHVPNRKKIEPFLEKQFDIVINLDVERHLPVHYIALISNTRFRVGPYDERFDFYDLMVSTQDKSDLKGYIFELRIILNSINFYGAP